MRSIELTQGKTALVDNEDYECLNRYKWFFDGAYAARKSPVKLYMHRVINGTPKGLETDHINRDRLDNRRTNLRSVTPSQNSMNLSRRVDNKSGSSGVHWRKDRGKWMTYLDAGGIRHYLGNYHSLEEAVAVREEAERRYYAI